ncbi:MAG TPA: lipopolysaccharide kinase InaA family protein [Candidatus Brocadiaceae bacterium]
MPVDQKFHTYFRDNIRWLVTGDSLNILDELLDSVAAGKNCEIVRNEPHKKILKYTHNQEASFYIKHYKIKDSTDALKSLFLPSKAYREWNKGHILLRNRLFTPELVAVGEKTHFGMHPESYIISKAIPDSVTMKTQLLDACPLSGVYEHIGKNTLLKNFISFVKNIHEHGFFHGELHAENVLVDRIHGTFYLIDVGRIKFRKNLPLSWKINDLSRFFYSVLPLCAYEEISALIDHYTSNTFNFKDKENIRKRVFGKIRKIRRRLWYGRTIKCLKNNAVFKSTTYDKYTINMLREWDVKVFIDMINEHTRSLTKKSNNVIKSSSKTAVTRIQASHETAHGVCIKEYKYPVVLKKILYFFFRSPARKAWYAAHGLLASNFLTPKPIALCEEKRLGILKKSFLIMEDISHCLPCYKYVSEKFNYCYDKVATEKKQQFIFRLATSFKQLHDSGIYHGDLKGSNIMIRELPDAWDFFYIDLDRVRFNTKITRKKKINNLTQLNASLANCITYTDRLRFYRIYTGSKKLCDEDKNTLRFIIQLSIQKNHFWKPKLQISRNTRIKTMK